MFNKENDNAWDNIRASLEETKDQSPDINMNMTMDIIMSEKPEVIKILQRNNMHCIGCPLAPFHNVEDAAFEHGLKPDKLLTQIQNASLLNSLTQDN